jgi:hypothetical protein
VPETAEAVAEAVPTAEAAVAAAEAERTMTAPERPAVDNSLNHPTIGSVRGFLARVCYPELAGAARVFGLPQRYDATRETLGTAEYNG